MKLTIKIDTDKTKDVGTLYAIADKLLNSKIRDLRKETKPLTKPITSILSNEELSQNMMKETFKYNYYEYAIK